MKKNEVIFSGILAMIIIIGGLIFWYTKTTPTGGEIEAATNLVKPVDRNIFVNPTSQGLKELKVFGDIPVKIEDNYSNENPFT